MVTLLWDASALSKRYTPEPGSEVVDALFRASSSVSTVSTILSYAETYLVLLRHRNRGAISRSVFDLAKAALQRDIIYHRKFTLRDVGASAILTSFAFMDAYNLNANDAAILRVFLDYQQTLPIGQRRCTLVAADSRLLVAARSEGLETLDPAIVRTGDIESTVAGVISTSS